MESIPVEALKREMRLSDRTAELLQMPNACWSYACNSYMVLAPRRSAEASCQDKQEAFLFPYWTIVCRIRGSATVDKFRVGLSPDFKTQNAADNATSCAADFFFYVDALKKYISDVRELAQSR